MNKKIIVFAAHPDDETLGCGGTIIKRLMEGYEVIVVVMTDGRHALSQHLGITTDPTPEEIKNIRKTEISKAMSILGVPSKNLQLWDFEDGKLADNAEVAAIKVLKTLNEIKPTEIFFPNEKDYHGDHRAAGLILRDCIEKLSFSPSTYRYQLGYRFSRVAPFMVKLLSLFRRNIVFVDVSQFLHQKKLALKEYQSQTTILYTNQKHPVVENTKRFLSKYEIFYRKC